MLEMYLNKDEKSACVKVGFVDRTIANMHKKSIEKSAGGWEVLKDLVGAATSAVGTGAGLVADYAKLFPQFFLLGASSGALGGIGYHIMKERMAEKDPREDLQRKIESIYKNKARELSDSRWMDKVRSMKDDLVRNHKKMSTEEYTEKYNALVSALDERKA